MQKLPIKSSRIESVSYAAKGGHLLVTIRLKAGLAYDIHTLKNPTRLFIDVMPSGAAAFQTKTPAGSVSKGQAKRRLVRVRPARVQPAGPALLMATISRMWLRGSRSTRMSIGMITARFLPGCWKQSPQL